ncbi:MAG: VCBS repeat-containing protein [Opitutales bacterium]|nr:VCBS repeat-containing protein [Opitutales bacterium]
MFLRHPFALPFRTSALALLFAGAAAYGSPSTPGFVYETETELQTLADLTGDGNPDLVVADKETGEFRVGEGSSDGTLSWRTHPGDSGLGSLSDLSAGRILDVDRDVLLFTEPMVNRIQLIDSPKDLPFTEKQFYRFTGVGPAVITAIDAPGIKDDHNPDFLDVFYQNIFDEYDDVSRLWIQGNPTGTLPLEESSGTAYIEALPKLANRVLLTEGDPKGYVYLEKYEEATDLVLRNPADSSFAEIDRITDLPTNARYVYGKFGEETEILFFAPGETEIFWSQFGDDEEFTQPDSFSVTHRIIDIRVIDSSGEPQLLLTHDDGSQATILQYEGEGNFEIAETLEAPNGQSFTGAMSVGGHLHLLTGEPGGPSSALQHYAFDGETHQFQEEQKMTELRPLGSRASVLAFDEDPLVESEAQLLGALEAGPWTSAFQLDDGEITVRSERFLGPEQGLGEAQEIILQDIPSGTAGGLSTQIDPDLSIFFRNAAVGEVTLELALEPQSGSFTQAIRPEMELSGQGGIFYRTSQNPSWDNYDPADPPTLFQDTTLTAVAVDPQGRLSNVVQATYTFPLDPTEQDSNNNGLPDFVMDAYGLDPLSNRADSSGNGFTDLQEVLAGTDPLDPNDQPDRNQVSFESPNSFDLFAVPATVDPDNAGASFASFPQPPQPGSGYSDLSTKVRVYQPSGFFLGSSPTLAPFLTADPAAIIRSIDSPGKDLFVIAMTERRFDVDADPAAEYGRQTAALIRPPKMEFKPFDDFDFGEHGGVDDLSAEADAWRDAAMDYYANFERPQIVYDPIDYESTLILLLVEAALGQKLYEREILDRPNLSLTPFRENENPLKPEEIEDEASDRNRAVSNRQLLDLQLRADKGGAESFLIKEMILTIEEGLAEAEANSDADNLTILAERLYRAHASYSEQGRLRAPFDALRRFIRTGDLENTGYLDEDLGADLGIPPGLLTSARDGRDELLSHIDPRQLETVYFYYDGGSPNGDCVEWSEVLFNPNDFDPENPLYSGFSYELRDDRGRPYPISRAVPLTEGTVFQVTGFVMDDAVCANRSLEVISQPSLAFINNANPDDFNGDLIPDNLQNLNPSVTLSPFADSSGNGYSDLQEILAGSDPYNANRVPTDPDGNPLPAEDLGPPTVRIETTEEGHSRIEFAYPSDYAPQIRFQLYESDDLETFEPVGKSAEHHGNGEHELEVSQSGEAKFYRFRMELR